MMKNQFNNKQNSVLTGILSKVAKSILFCAFFQMFGIPWVQGKSTSEPQENFVLYQELLMSLKEVAPDILKAKTQLELTSIEKNRTLLSNWTPSLTATAQQNQKDGREFVSSLSISWPLFTFGSDSFGSKAAVKNFEQARLHYEIQQNEWFQSLSDLIFRLILKTENIKGQKEVLNLRLSSFENAKRRFRAGLISQVELLNMEISYQESAERLALEENNFQKEKSQLQLLLLMGQSDRMQLLRGEGAGTAAKGAGLRHQDLFHIKSWPFLKQKPLGLKSGEKGKVVATRDGGSFDRFEPLVFKDLANQNPNGFSQREIFSLKLEADALKWQRRAVGADFLPTLSLGASWIAGGSKEFSSVFKEQERTLSLNLSWQLWDQGRKMSEMRALVEKASLNEKLLAFKAVQNDLDTPLLLEDLSLRYKQVHASLERIEKRKLILLALQKGFQGGRVSVLDLSQGFSEYNAAMDDHHYKVYEFHKKVVELCSKRDSFWACLENHS